MVADATSKPTAIRARADAWWANATSSRTAYLIAASIGLASIVMHYGWIFVFGTSSYWRMPSLQDHRMYVMGYRYFLHEPWHWPLFEVATNLPGTKSVAFSDTPLLWALVNKCVATVVPPWGEYSANAFLGLWYGLASTLQAVFGVANLRALGHKSLAAAVVTSLFFISVPAWAFRLPHASLFAHFLLLWALYLYLRTRADGPCSRRLRVAQIAQLAVSALLNVYLTVMSLAVFVASLSRRPLRRSAPAWLASGCAVVLASLALAGYFAREATTSVSGFSSAGSNLLGPVLPLSSGWIGTGAWVDPTGLQYEGICYLGASVLALLIVVLARPTLIATASRRHTGLAVICGAAALFALSNHVYVGSFRLFSYPIPSALHWIPDQFRCPGRFSWLPMYVVVIFVLSYGFTFFATGWKRFILPLLAIIQLVDVSSQWSMWREQMDARPTPLDVPRWQALLSHSSEVYVFPANDCNSDRSFGSATQIQYLASEIGVPINGVYTARPARDCNADITTLLDFHARPNTLYVFVVPMVGFAKELAANGIPCAEFAFGEVCHLDRSLINSLEWPMTPQSAPLEFGDPLDVADPAATYLQFGWASAESDGRWTEGAIARVAFRPAGTPPSNPRLRLQAFALLCEQRADEDVDVVIEGELLGTLHFSRSSNAAASMYTLAIKHPEILARPIVHLDFRPRDFRSPSTLGCRHSPREIAMKVHRIWIEGDPDSATGSGSYSP